MYYADVLKPEYIGVYKSQHKTLFQKLQQIKFSAVLHQKIKDVYKDNIYMSFTLPGVITQIFTNNAELLILKLYSILFSKEDVKLSTLHDTIFKGIRNEYFDSDQMNRIRNSKWMEKIYGKTVRKQVEDSLRFFRNNIVAHTKEMDLIQEQDINIEEVITIFDTACDHFQLLSFKPEDIYDKKYMIGYDFSNFSEPLFAQEEKSTISFLVPYLRADVVNSYGIKKVYFEYSENIEDELRRNIDDALDEINKRR